MKIQLLLLATLFLLNLVDVASTFYGLSLGATELTPLFSRESVGLKICLPLVYAGVFAVTYRLCSKRAFSAGLRILNVNLLILVGIYAVVVANNVFGIVTNVGGETLEVPV